MPEESRLDMLGKVLEKTDYITASIIATEAYDIDHEICAHSEYDNPLSLVEMHQAEDWYTHGRLEQLMERYRVRRVGEHFKCSFFELINQPRYVVDSIMALAKKAEDDNNRRTQAALNQMNTEKEQIQKQLTMKP